MSYKISGSWETVETQTVESSDGDRHQVRTQVAPLRDGRSGRVYPTGAQRVTVNGRAVRGGTFKGETAWMDVDRLAGDIRYAIMRDRFDHVARKVTR